MTPALTEDGVWQYEAIDVNIVPDLYVTWIVDIWKGDRNDPAVEVKRWLGVWDVAVLETEAGEAIDPSFQDTDRYWTEDPTPTIKPLHWHELASVKAADKVSKGFKRDQENLLNPEKSPGYGHAARAQKELYNKFMDAIDVLADDPENKDAWAAVDAWRAHNDLQYEK